MFNQDQPSYGRLRSIVAERTSPLIAWVGSGLSKPAGLPLWRELKDRLCQALLRKALTLDAEGGGIIMAKHTLASKESNYWVAFDILQDALGAQSYASEIKSALSVALRISVPSNYRDLWSLRLDGVFNLNLDRLATRALVEFRHVSPNEFSGKHASKYTHLLKSNAPFICNLHGVLDDADTWVLTSPEIKSLLKNRGYINFLRSCLSTRTILFIGLSADDFAVGGHLETLSRQGISFGPHFWVTERSDLNTDKWAESVGIEVIRYKAPSNDHAELEEFFRSLINYLPQDQPAEPITPTVKIDDEEVDTLPEPAALLNQDTDTIRKVLNREAIKILAKRPEQAYVEYDAFFKSYNQCIYRAWYVDATAGENELFGYRLVKEIASGAFGRVFLAVGPDNCQVAIKVLREEVRRRPEMLQSFRRGVRSMQILSKHRLTGMVPYHQAAEIPAMAVMDFVDGPNLSIAVRSGYIKTWADVLIIGVELSRIITKAHSLPERVLHRDIKPSNIMLRNYYSNPSLLDVVVLDFDLSWHKDAAELSVLDPSSLSGYLAPEQLTRRSTESTRNAAVDAYGLGMTLFFLRSGIDPVSSQHKHSDWQNILEKAILKCHSSNWLSIPMRFLRLIRFATLDKQSERIDLSHLLRELERLQEAESDPNSVISAELNADEIACRCDFSTNYEWNPDRNCVQAVTANGISICLTGLET